jgi:hypothetical protein
MVLELFDFDHLRNVRSPFYEVVERTRIISR